MTVPTPELLTWDTDFLGFPVARLRAAALDAGALAAVLAGCRAAGTRLLYLSADPADAVTAAAAQSLGLLLADHRLTFEKPLLAALPPVGPARLQIRAATAYSAPLERLALQSGAYSRFRRDPRFAPDVFPRLYQQWLRAALAGAGGQRVWTAETGGEVLALLVSRAVPPVFTMELLAVDVAARGQGLGWQMLEAAQQQASMAFCRSLRLVTQADNLPADRLYRRFGFAVVGEEHLYHCWL